MEKQKFYDRILREGVFSGYLYAREDVQILEVLLGELGVLVERMDIESVKHLKVRIHFYHVLISFLQYLCLLCVFTALN